MEEPGQLKRALLDATAGAISGGISRTVTSPLDVIKIRFQVQLEPTSSWGLIRKDISGSSKYSGMFQSTKDIFREEGLPGFWRGNVPALLMVMPYTAIQFAVLHKLKTFASGSSKTVAGCAATVGSYPFDLLRTILASQGEPKVFGEFNNQIKDAVLSLIDREREGEDIDQALIKNIVGIYVDVGQGSTKYYERDFEETMFKATASFYSNKAGNWIKNDSYKDYMIKDVEGFRRFERITESSPISFVPK